MSGGSYNDTIVERAIGDELQRAYGQHSDPVASSDKEWAEGQVKRRLTENLVRDPIVREALIELLEEAEPGCLEARRS